MPRSLFIGYRNLNRIWCDFPTRCLDGSWGRRDEHLCDQLFEFVWNSFLNRAASGRCCPSVWTVAVQLHAISILRLEHSDHGVCRLDGWISAAHYFHIKACASWPWRLTSGWLNFVCTSCLIKDRIRTGTHIIRMVAYVFQYLCFGTKSFSLWNTNKRPAVLLRRPDGCNLE
jgi:hypothetical protein